MKKAKTFSAVLIFVVVLVMATALCSCKDEEKIECGSLTINNLPLVPSVNIGGVNVYWNVGVYFDENITTQTLFSNWVRQNNQVAWSYNPNTLSHSGTSPFTLADSNKSGEGFTKSGTYLVVILPEDSSAQKQYGSVFMSGVTFKNGKVAIDYNDMTRYDSLP